MGALRAIEDNPKLEILLRITETQAVGTEKGINEKIIRYNNTQNKITLSDFRSNDKIQLDLLNKFKTVDFKILGQINYIRKRGDKLLRKGTYNLKLEDLAKIGTPFRGTLYTNFKIKRFMESWRKWSL